MTNYRKLTNRPLRAGSTPVTVKGTLSWRGRPDPGTAFAKAMIRIEILAVLLIGGIAIGYGVRRHRLRAALHSTQAGGADDPLRARLIW